MKIETNGYSSIEQAAAALFAGSQDASGKADRLRNAEGRSFAEILSEKSDELKPGIMFSKHAAERLTTRNISLSDDQLNRLTKGTRQAEGKGINSSLVMVDDLAFIVNTKSNTVVTAMDPGDDKNVFTNIDGAVIA